MADLNARIKPKKSSTAGEVPQAADLEVAEIAVNTADGKLWTKHADGSIVEMSGAVGSVNGQTGAVALDLGDMNDVVNAAGDPYYSNVALLLRGNGTVGSSVILDEGPSSMSPGATLGTIVNSSTEFKYGGQSIRFPAAATYFRFNNIDGQLRLGADDFTIEWWWRTDSAITQNTYFFATGTVGAEESYGAFVGTNGLNFRYSTNGSSISNVTATWTPSIDTWYHIAIVRSNNELMMFVDGTQIGSTTPFSFTLYDFSVSNTLGFGGIMSSGNPVQGIIGYIDDFRLTKGVARYTSDFTTPLELPAASGAVPTDGQVLAWVDANNQWEPADNSVALSELTDTNITAPSLSVAASGRYTTDYGTYPSSDGNYWVRDDVDQLWLVDRDADIVDHSDAFNASVGKTMQIFTDSSFTNLAFEFVIQSIVDESSRHSFDAPAGTNMPSPGGVIYFRIMESIDPTPDGSVLAYDKANRKWEPATPSSNTVDSVNSQTGVVSLGVQDMNDVAYAQQAATATWTGRWTIGTLTLNQCPSAGEVNPGTTFGACIIIANEDADGVGQASNLGLNGQTHYYKLNNGPWTEVTAGSVNTACSGVAINKESIEMQAAILAAQVGDTFYLSDGLPATDIPPADGQVLTWVDANSQWEPASPSVRSLSDFDGVTLEDGAGLIYDAVNGIFKQNQAPADSLQAMAYKFKDTTSGDPTAGKVALDNADPTLATEIRASKTTENGVDMTFIFDMAVGAAQAIYIQRKDNASEAHAFRTTGPAVDSGTYISVPVEHVNGTGTFSNNKSMMVGVYASGMAGALSPVAVPSTATSAGTAGDIRYDAGYVYICVAANTWKRAALTSW